MGSGDPGNGDGAGAATASAAGGGAARGARGRGAPPVQPKPEELAQMRAKTEQIEGIVKELKAKHADPDLVGDVEVYAKAGRYLLEFPELFGDPERHRSLAGRARSGHRAGEAIERGQSPWNTGKKQIHAYYSEIDGSVQPYGVTLPADYDRRNRRGSTCGCTGGRTTRRNRSSSSAFRPSRRRATLPVADQGQIQLDVFGRINGAGYHWAGEADVFEAHRGG